MKQATLRRTSAASALALALLLLLAIARAGAAPGTLDPSFHGGSAWYMRAKDGVVTTRIGVSGSAVLGMAIQPNGKIVAAGGAASAPYYQAVIALARYDRSGSRDKSFGSGGTVTTGFGTGTGLASAVALQPDAKIVVAGTADPETTFQAYMFGLARYRKDGSLDPSFGKDGLVTTPFGVESHANSIAVQPDGKIVAAGIAYDGSQSTFALVRYNANGTLDGSFGTEGKVTTSVGDGSFAAAVAVQPDGKLVVAGGQQFALARYNPDGSLDSSFGGDGTVITSFGTASAPWAVVLQPDGKIVAVGQASTTAHSDFALARYNPDGSLDTTFGNGGKVAVAIGQESAWANAAALQRDGKVVVAGSVCSQNCSDPRALKLEFALARFNGDGSLDTHFGAGGKLTTALGTESAWANAVAVQPNGRIVVGGVSGFDLDSHFTLARFLGGSERCIVPKAKGKRLADARRAITQALCSVGAIRHAFATGTRKGRVIGQTPKPGARRAVGAKVSLLVSKGAPKR